MIYKVNNDIFAKTKILCTLGPASFSTDHIKKMIDTGMDGVRLNFSHGSYSFYEEVFSNIHTACIEESYPIAILIDLQGPKIRIGELVENEIEIIAGELIEITVDDIPGYKNKISTSYKQLVKDANIGDPILIDDGLIRLKITGKTKNSVVCEIESGGIVKPRKGMNLPGMKLSTPSITEKDFNDIEFALKHRVDYIALSFVRSPDDIIQLREWINKQKPENEISIIAKIEKKEAVDNFEEILAAADGIMIARGDLGVELEPQSVPIIQKEIIKRCNESGKLVITATQMLESMINNPIPTRAEASDVANAVWDGTDVVMLSGETSVGKYPLRTIKIMNDIVRKAEMHHLNFEREYEIPYNVEDNFSDSMGRALIEISRQLNAAAIVVFTIQGRTAKIISKYRPEAKIIAVSSSFETMNKLNLRWGVTSIYKSDINKENIAIDVAKKLLLDSALVKEGDLIIFASGAPYSEKSRSNWLRFEIL